MGAQMNIHHFEWAELAEATPITLPRPSSGNFFEWRGGEGWGVPLDLRLLTEARQRRMADACAIQRPEEETNKNK